MREWTDPQTGRTIRQLTEGTEGGFLGYFRVPRRLPNGQILARRPAPNRGVIMIDVESGEITPLDKVRGMFLGLRESDGRLWFVGRREENEETTKIFGINLPDGEAELVAEIPATWPARGSVISCDGSTLVACFHQVDQSREYLPPNSLNPELFWNWTSRPRNGQLKALDLNSGEINTLVELEKMMPIHPDTSPTDAGLMKFAHDDFDAYCQRIWSIRLDGSGLTKIREQERGELITHEFWWPGGDRIAFKYQDRRSDKTIDDLPWAEYSPIGTQFGLADLNGKQQYLSDPINHYHSHINVSEDKTLLTGEGTDGHSFVYAAPFSPQSTRIDFVPLATINTPYIPFRGQEVHSSFTRDNKWLVYNDTIEGQMQICAVQVDF